jgi:hypothetical protein
MPEKQFTEVEITTRQLTKCEWNLELASNFLNLLASLASAFFLLSMSLFSPLVHTVQMLSKDMILASFSLNWRVKILSYSPVWRVP